VGIDQKTIHYHLGKMATLPNSLNGDLRVPFRLSQGFTIAQVAQKHGWTDPVVRKNLTLSSLIRPTLTKKRIAVATLIWLEVLTDDLYFKLTGKRLII
jgi:hypothetical protein